LAFLKFSFQIFAFSLQVPDKTISGVIFLLFVNHPHNRAYRQFRQRQVETLFSNRPSISAIASEAPPTLQDEP